MLPFWFVDRFHYELVESTLLHHNQSKIANYAESTLSMWFNIANINMNKRGS